MQSENSKQPNTGLETTSSPLPKESRALIKNITLCVQNNLDELIPHRLDTFRSSKEDEFYFLDVVKDNEYSLFRLALGENGTPLLRYLLDHLPHNQRNLMLKDKGYAHINTFIISSINSAYDPAARASFIEKMTMLVRAEPDLGLIDLVREHAQQNPEQSAAVEVLLNHLESTISNSKSIKESSPPQFKMG